jgi:hypothetical protein
MAQAHQSEKVGRPRSRGTAPDFADVFNIGEEAIIIGSITFVQDRVAFRGDPTGVASLLSRTRQFCYRRRPRCADSSEIVEFVARRHILRWRKDECARSSTSTWTRSMRPSNSATTLICVADRWRLATPPSEAWLPRPAMKPAHSACARPCRPLRPCGDARTGVRAAAL